RRADFIKVSHRQELDISIVAAAFCVDADGDGVVRHARLAYGGVAERPRRALAAEQALVGRSFSKSADVVAEALKTEFTPISDVRSGAEYRLGLVESLWRKFHAGDTSLVHDAEPAYQAVGTWP